MVKLTDVTGGKGVQKVFKRIADDHEKHIEANIKMEKKLKIKPAEEREGVKAHLEEHEKYSKALRDSIEKDSRAVMFARKPRLPKKLIIFSVEWDILYFDKQIEVDIEREERLFGQVLHERNLIRIFRGKRKRECIFETIFHEWFHIVITELGYRNVMGDKNEQFTEAISSALNDFFWRNFGC